MVQVYWSYNSDGYVKVWKNGSVVHERTGPNMYNHPDGIKEFKLGLYAWNWKTTPPSPPEASPRVIFHDEVRVGDASSNYDEVKPRGNKVIQKEVENLQAVTNGDSHSVFDQDGCSEYQCTQFFSDNVGDQVTYMLNVPEARTYKVKVGVKKYKNRGKFQLTIGPDNHGSEVDLFSLNEEWSEIDIGNVTFGSAGDKPFKFTVTGKNVSSLGYNLSFDYIKLIPQ
ncbi:heparin lyase I family protein [Paenibacillus roseipurpureus]|uniref:Heparin lyase I family protein n=1 Tax=Paenibacillus roseopurpureus TaxID=2918901 RepID=A0AA96RJ68_9BACL|nr:heparin lyase I family protein [Paenibacillus sp. MBLB1832]WNR42831.1 heparin lyase I family protein [Paenibacillus sp. MBLB1832]